MAKDITTEEAQKLLEEVGYAAAVYVWIQRQHDREERAVLNNAVVYEPFYGKQFGSRSNKENAELAIKQITKVGARFRIFSNVFDSVTGEYNITD